MMNRDYKTPVGAAPPDWRGLCEELLRELENAIAVHYGEGGTHHISAADAVIARADAALAQLEPEGRPAPAPVGEVAELVALIRQIALAWEPDACLLGNMTAGQLARAADLLERQAAPVPVPAAVGEAAHIRRMCDIILGSAFGNKELDSLALLVGHHPDVLNASPVPAEGEVAELVAWLRDRAESTSLAHNALRITRAADLLEQRHPTPVPVSERLPGADDCTANPRNGEGEWCWGWRQDSSNSPFSGRWRMVPRAFMVEEATHWLPAHALPLPSGEVQP